jgi:hypothetical protein
MNQYAGTLIVCVCLGAVAAIGAGCDSGGSNTGGSAGAATGTAGTATGTAGTATGTAGAGTGTAGAGTGTAGAGTGTAGMTGTGGASAGLLPVDMSGFVSAPTLGIQGSWYGYGDGQGSDGMIPTSDCVMKGMHTAADCSKITAPPFGSFPQTTPGSMCTSGTVAKVIMGSVGCTAPATMCPDYSNLFGAGIGLDLNNAGNDGGTGMKMPFNATLAGITGIEFDLDMAPPTNGIRVEFPTVGTENTSAMWKPGTSNKSPLVVGHNVLMFADVASPTFVKPAVPFDPTKLLSIQFHVPTTTSAAVPYAFCISGLSVITTGSPATGTGGASSGGAGAPSGGAGASSGGAGASSGGAGASSGGAGASSGGAGAPSGGGGTGGA